MTRKVALLIGVSEYGEGIPSLSAPLHDIERMKQILEHRNMGGFDDVKVLPNPNSIGMMQTAVAEMFASCGKEDLVLLYFSGHGIADDNYRLFLGIKGTSMPFYKATSVPASFIQDISYECCAKRQVIILDCCYSGAFAEGWQTKGVGLDIGKQLWAQGKELGSQGRVVLTSSSKTQTSFQQEGEKLSLYTKYFIEGIETGAADKQGTGKIYVHQIHDYAKGKVQEVKPKQQPDIILDKDAYNIILSQAPINDPEADFRRLVEENVKNGELSFIALERLNIKQTQWKIAEEKAQQIIDEVLTPHREYLESIKCYEQIYQKAVDFQYPLSQQFQDELQGLQEDLGLKDEDVTKIQGKIEINEQNKSNEENSANFPPKTSKKSNREQKKDNELISEQFIKLRDLLAEEKWQEADEETTRLMLELGDKGYKDYLNDDDCKNFPQEELRTIDKLWLDYSDGKFGFSVQKEIYLEEGGKLDDNYYCDGYEKMCDRIGWLKNNQWLSYSNLTFDKNTACVGHLPTVSEEEEGRLGLRGGRYLSDKGYGVEEVVFGCLGFEMGDEISFLFSKL